MQASKDSLWVEIRVAESDEQIERAVETVHSAHRHGVISDSIAQILARIAAERSRQLSTTDRRGSVKQHDHTTADDASRYRPDAEVKQAWLSEPIKRMQAFLRAQQCWDESREQAMIKTCQAQVQAAVDAFEGVDTAPVESIIDYVYAQWPQALAEQREDLLERASRREAEHE